MSTKQLNAHVPADDHEAVLREAQDKGVSPHEYIKNIILQRHEKTIQLANGDASLVQSRLEGKIEALREQLEKTQRELASANEKSGLGSIERKNGSIEKQIEEALLKKEQEFELKGLREKVTELESELEETEKERDEYKAQVDADNRTAKLIERGSQALEIVGRIAPKPVERIMNGLAGLLGAGETGGMGSLEMDEETQQALVAGQAIMRDVPPEHRAAVVDVLRFIVAVPSGLSLIQRSKPYQTWAQSQAS